MPVVQAHMRFSGNVQGVGFRYTVLHSAQRLGITGWVRNMSDGSVEAVAQGNEESLKSLLEAIQHRFSDYISNTDVKWSEASDGFTTFDVRY